MVEILEKFSARNKNNKLIMEKYQKLKEYLDKFKFKDEPVKVFLQGSYKNSTDIKNSSDIDIVVMYTNYFRSNIRDFKNDSGLESYETVKEIEFSDEELNNYDRHTKNVTSIFAEFKSELHRYLVKRYGNQFVHSSNKTIKVNVGNFYFDIVACFEYRYYSEFSDIDSYDSGITFDSESNEYIINFPKIHSENLEIKMKNTDGNFKETVRIFKNIIKELDEDTISSYHIESVLYNVESETFIEYNKEIRIKNIYEKFNYLLSKFEDLVKPDEIVFLKNDFKIEQLMKFVSLIRLFIDEYGG